MKIKHTLLFLFFFIGIISLSSQNAPCTYITDTGDTVTFTPSNLHSVNPPPSAQSCATTNNLPTPYNQNNGQRGIMFDITALSNITISCFDVNMDPGTTGCSIYYKVGTHVGFQTNAAAWTLIGTVNVTGLGANQATPVPLNVNVSVNAGCTVAFYITRTTANGPIIDYTNGTVVGNVYCSNADLQVKDGTGKEYLFSTSFSPRRFNGTIYYNLNSISGGGVINGPLSMCTGSSQTYTFTGTGWTTYTWTVPVGTTITSGQGTNTITITAGSNPGQICVTPSSACGNGPVTCINVSIAPSPTSTYTVTNVTCFGSNNGSATITASPAGSYTYAWSPSGGNAATANNLSPGTYTVTATNSGGCSTSQTITITQPTALTTGSSQVDVTCNGANTGSATVTPAGGSPTYTYAWSPSGGNAGTANNLSAGTYTCTITDSHGCILTQSFTITSPSAIALATSSTPSTCGNPNGSATVVANGGVGPYNYSWAPSGGNLATASNLMGGSYTCTVTDANGCVNTATVNIPNTSAPTASIAFTNVLCSGGNTGSATVTPAGGTGPYQYAWSPSGGNAATENNLVAGSYTCTVTDANGCVVTASTTITEPQVVSITAPLCTPPTCFNGNNGSASVTVSGGIGPYSYAWSPSGGNSATANNLTAGSYTCTVTDANGCTMTATATITQPPALTTTFSQVDELCNGANTGSATVTPAGGTPGYSYAWAPSGGNLSTASSLTAGNYTCTITDANSCVLTQSFIITEPTAIVITPTAVDAHCSLADGSASATAVGGTGAYSYNWMPGNVSGQNLNNVAAGTYSITVTDANGCAVTNTVTINNLPGVVAALGNITNVDCFGNATGVINVTQNGGNGPYTYAWLPNISVSNSASGVPSGAYQVTVTDADGCTSTVSVTITQPPVLTLAATANPSAVCAGSPVTLNAVPAGGTPVYNVMWNPGNLLGNSQNINPTSSGTDTAYVMDANGCTATATVNVTVYPMPTAVFSSDVVSGCEPVCVNFTDNSSIANPGNITAWDWDFGDGNTSTSQNPIHCYTTSGNYTVILSVKSADGCTNTITMTNYINVFANPIAVFSASPQPTTIVNAQIYFTDMSVNASSWQWSFGDVLNSTSNLQNPSFTYFTPTCYLVLLNVTSPDGCTDSVSHPVCIDPDVEIYVPNAFTPNGDIHNEIFIPVGTGLDANNYQLWIFDRWGNMIFTTKDMSKGWDGRANGGQDICQADTYVWKISTKDNTGNQHTLVGKVALIR